MKRQGRRILLLGVLLLTAMLLGAGMTASAETRTVSYDVTYGQTEARSMLALINEFRTGEDAWYWNSDNTTKTVCTNLNTLAYDYDLEAIAMQRAAEIAMSFSHTRPDGSSWSSMEVNGKDSWAENIAIGHGTAGAVFTDWQENSDAYSGQGHRRNMLGGYRTIGIGHAVVNGVHCWVQEFGTSEPKTPVTAANDGLTRVSVDLSSGSIHSIGVSLTANEDITTDSTGATLSLEAGYSAAVPELTARINGITVSVPCEWSIDDTSCAELGDGKVIGKNVGTTVLRTTVYNVEVPVTLEVTPLSVRKAEVTLGAVPVFAGSAVKPSVAVVLHGQTLAEGTDYTLSYADNEAPGTASVTVAGCGNYVGTITKTYTIVCNHTYDEGTITTAPTCVKTGVRTSTCTICGGTRKETVAATGVHSYRRSVTSGSKKENCCEDLVYTYVCRNGGCNDKYTETVSATGKHKYGSVVWVGSSDGPVTGAYVLCQNSNKKIALDVTYTDKTNKSGSVTRTYRVELDGKTYTDKWTYTPETNGTSGGTGTSGSTGTSGTTAQTGGSTGTAGGTAQTGGSTGTAAGVKKNQTFTYGNLKYKVTAVSGKTGKVTVTGAKNKKLTSVKIPSAVKRGGVTLKVTAVADKAFKGMTALKSVTIGANVTKIGKNAFYGCKKLTTVTVKTAKLKKSTVGANAFKGIKAGCTFKVPKAKKAAYRAILKARGAGKKFKVKTI